MSVPPVYDREDNISDFWRFHLASFSGTRTPLRAKEWLNDMKIQLTDRDMVEVRGSQVREANCMEDFLGWILCECLPIDNLG